MYEMAKLMLASYGILCKISRYTRVNFGTFYPQNRTSGGNNFNDVPDNQLLKFYLDVMVTVSG